MSVARSIASNIARQVAKLVTLADGGATAGLTGDVYISPSGDDTGSGSAEDPWQTVGRLNTWMASLSAGSYTAVVRAGSYTDAGFSFSNNSTVDLTVEFESGVSVDTSALGTSAPGISAENNPTSSSVWNLRGATFTGNGVGSANGIGTTNDVTVTVNGLNAIFSGYDDGVSFHGSVTAIDQIVINDCTFQNCTKSAFAHVNSSRGTHNRCTFIGRSGATLGIGANQSTVASEFNECTFTPAATDQTIDLSLTNLNSCVLGSYSSRVNLGNFSTRTANLIDCFVNFYADGVGDLNMTRCYGFVDFRIRGTATPTAEWVNCVLEGRTNTTIMANGSFDGGSGNWLGGSHLFRDCVIYDYGTAFAYASTTQRDHMNSNWTVDHCCMFENTTNFQTGLTLGNDLVTTDPELGSRLDTNQANWAVGLSGSCIGTGTSGGNIGF